MLKRFIDQLIAELGWNPINPNDDGTYTLLFDPDLRILLRENNPPGVTLSAVVGGLPEKEQEQFLVRTMSANLFGIETGGSVLGLDAEGKNITLFAHISPNAVYKEFRDLVEDFANYVEAWREETKLYVKGESTS